MSVHGKVISAIHINLWFTVKKKSFNQLRDFPYSLCCTVKNPGQIICSYKKYRKKNVYWLGKGAIIFMGRGASVCDDWSPLCILKKILVPSPLSLYFQWMVGFLLGGQRRSLVSFSTNVELSKWSLTFCVFQKCFVRVYNICTAIIQS